MRLLLTLGFVLAAAVVLIVGYATQTAVLIYASIAFSIASSIGVAIGTRRARRGAEPEAPDRRPPPAPTRAMDADFTALSSWTAVSGPVDRPPLSAVGMVTQEQAASQAAASQAAVSRPPSSRPAVSRQEPGSGDLPFPIEDYDRLVAAQILPLLPELDDFELEQVLDREESGAGRVSILNRIDALLGPDPNLP